MFKTSCARGTKHVGLVAALALVVTAAHGAGDAPSEPPTPPQVIARSQRPPVFPPAAKAARFQGEVTVRVTVLPSGLPDNVLVIHCSHPKVGFEDAATAAVKKWRFIPAMHRGVAVEYETQYKLTFGRRGVGVSASGLTDAVATRLNAATPGKGAPDRRTNRGGSRGSGTLRRGR